MMALMTADGWKHLEFLFSGATALAIVGHAVNSFPTPKNVYGQWLLGVIKFAVGQRISAINAFQGKDTAVAAVPRGMGTGSGVVSDQARDKTVINPDGSVTIDSAHLVKTSQTLPPPDKP